VGDLTRPLFILNKSGAISMPMAITALEFIQSIHGLVLTNDNDLFWACYSEDYELVHRILNEHPTLTLYSLCSWDDENWVYRGFRNVNRLGHLLGATDLGVDYKRLLWTEQLE
jgi:hypothetical protein